TRYPVEPPRRALPAIEWSAALQALNLVVRCYLAGEPLAGWALDLLAQEDPAELDGLIDGVSRSLIDDRDAPLVRRDLRLRRQVARQAGRRARDEMVFAIRLAVAARRGGVPDDDDGTPAARRVLACAGLAAELIGTAMQPGMSAPALLVDDAPVTTH